MNHKMLAQLIAAEQQAASATPRSRAKAPAAFRDFAASELYCKKCKASMAVKEKLLLTLPSGDLYDYVCSNCGDSLGTKTA